MGGAGVEPTGHLGAVPAADGGFQFRVWAPRARRVAVVYPERRRRPVPLHSVENGYFEGTDPDARPGESYWLSVDGRRVPDPTSRSQPLGSGGPSALVDLRALGANAASPTAVPLARAVLYQ